MSVLDEISKERQKQVYDRGYRDAHDDEQVNGELADAAACYAATVMPYQTEEFEGRGGETFHSFIDLWPVSWANDHWKPEKPRREKLIIAAALLVAEIERLDRIPHLVKE